MTTCLIIPHTSRRYASFLAISEKSIECVGILVFLIRWVQDVEALISNWVYFLIYFQWTFTKLLESTFRIVHRRIAPMSNQTGILMVAWWGLSISCCWNISQLLFMLIFQVWLEYSIKIRSWELLGNLIWMWSDRLGSFLCDGHAPGPQFIIKESLPTITSFQPKVPLRVINWFMLDLLPVLLAAFELWFFHRSLIWIELRFQYRA